MSATPVMDIDPQNIFAATLQAYPESVHLARELVRSALASWGLGAFEGDAVQIMSELASNAARLCEGRTIRAWVSRIDQGVEMCVWDDHPGRPAIQQPHPFDTSGRGLGPRPDVCVRRLRMVRAGRGQGRVVADRDRPRIHAGRRPHSGPPDRPTPASRGPAAQPPAPLNCPRPAEHIPPVPPTWWAPPNTRRAGGDHLNRHQSLSTAPASALSTKAAGLRFGRAADLLDREVRRDRHPQLARRDQAGDLFQSTRKPRSRRWPPPRRQPARRRCRCGCPRRRVPLRRALSPPVQVDGGGDAAGVRELGSGRPGRRRRGPARRRDRADDRPTSPTTVPVTHSCDPGQLDRKHPASGAADQDRAV